MPAFLKGHTKRIALYGHHPVSVWRRLGEKSKQIVGYRKLFETNDILVFEKKRKAICKSSKKRLKENKKKKNKKSFVTTTILISTRVGTIVFISVINVPPESETRYTKIVQNHKNSCNERNIKTVAITPTSVETDGDVEEQREHTAPLPLYTTPPPGEYDDDDAFCKRTIRSTAGRPDVTRLVGE